MGSFKKLTLVLFTSLFFSSVYCQQEILSDDTIPTDASFTVTCDASRVNWPSDATNIISRLLINRQVESSAESTVAQYNPFSPIPGLREVRNIPGSRKWDILFSGGDGTGNRDTMRAVLRVNDSHCDDTGSYKCIVDVFVAGSTTATVMQQQNLTVTAAIENHVLTADPHNGNDLLASTYPSGSNVTLTCRIQGPANLQMVWRQRHQGLSGFTDYPVMNDIVVKAPEPVLGVITSCPQFNYESTLNVIVEEPNQFTTFFPTVYQCVVREDGTFSPAISTANITLGIETMYYQQNILSDDTVAKDASFTVTCDGSRVNWPSDATNMISHLLISRQVGSSAESNVAIYNPSSAIPESREFRNIPASRKWDITFSGGDAVDNRDTMRVVLRVSDSTCDDTGIYQCTVNIFGTTGDKVTVMEQQNLTVTAGIENHVLTADPHNGNDLLASTYPSGSNVTLTCRIQGRANLQMVWRQRQQGLSSFTDYPVMNDSVVETPDPVLNIPVSRKWDFTFSGGDGLDNRGTMRAVLRVNDSQCDDTGIYKCTVEIHLSTGGTVTVMQQQNLTVTAGIENHILTANPLNGNDLLASNYTSLSNVTLTCRLQGPANLQMVWRQRRHGLSSFTDYPVSNDIVVMTPEPVLSVLTSCPQYNYESTLNIIVEEPNQFTTFFPTVYQCVVREDGTLSPDISTANITLGIETMYYQQNILSDDTVPKNASFTVTCDGGRVNWPLDATNTTSRLLISRQVGSSAESNVAIYNPSSAIPGSREVRNIPNSRKWDITFSGGDGTDNRDTMRAVLRVNDSHCDDTGIYKCIVDVYVTGGATATVMQQQNLTVTAPAGSAPGSQCDGVSGVSESDPGKGSLPHGNNLLLITLLYVVANF